MFLNNYTYLKNQLKFAHQQRNMFTAMASHYQAINGHSLRQHFYLLN